jgi:hypothetical protein
MSIVLATDSKDWMMKKESRMKRPAFARSMENHEMLRSLLLVFRIMFEFSIFLRVTTCVDFLRTSNRIGGIRPKT